MTKREREYEKCLDMIKEYEEKAKKVKEQLEKERDALVIEAVRVSQMTRAEGAKLAKLIRNKESFDMIMEMELLPKQFMENIKKAEEAEETNETRETSETYESEEDDYEYEEDSMDD